MKKKISNLQSKLYDIDAEAINLFHEIVKGKIINFSQEDYKVEIRPLLGNVRVGILDKIQDEKIYIKSYPTGFPVDEIADTDELLMLLREIAVRIS